MHIVHTYGAYTYTMIHSHLVSNKKGDEWEEAESNTKKKKTTEKKQHIIVANK